MRMIKIIRRIDKLHEENYKIELDIDYQLLTLKEAMDVGDELTIEKIKRELKNLIKEREWLREEIKQYN